MATEISIFILAADRLAEMWINEKGQVAAEDDVSPEPCSYTQPYLPFLLMNGGLATKLPKETAHSSVTFIL